MSTIIDKSIDTISIMIEKYSMEVASIASLKDNCEILIGKDSSDSKAKSEAEELSNNMNKYFRDYIKSNLEIERISLIDLSGNIISDSEDEFYWEKCKRLFFS